MNKIWDDRYNREEYYYGTEPNDYLRETAKLIRPGGAVLCLAEGEGRNAVFLAKLGYHVTAVDFSAIALSKLEKLAVESGVQVQTVCRDLTEFEFGEGLWDGIVSIWCHLPSPLRIQVHNKLIHGLKVGGIYIYEAYTPDQIPLATGGPKDPDMMPTAQILMQELKGLQFHKLQELRREIHEGLGHNGLSAVVQVLGKRSL